MSLESYAHATAKNVFAGWLREIASESWTETNANPYVKLGDFGWRVNRPGPHFGVWLEYPISFDVGVDPVWDELSADWEARPPTYEELAVLRYPIEFIADIAVQHKGRISHAIEIVYKHPPSKQKLSDYRLLGLRTWVIPASWVLDQVKRPDSIPPEFCA